MKIKDFKVGQTVFVMDGCSSRTEAAEVVKIGTKYVTISGNWALKFGETAASRPYLIEHTEIGAPRLLFPSMNAVDDYREREELKGWVRGATGWSKIDRYTLGQLREVKKILEVNQK